MPRERKQRGPKHAEKRRTDRLDQEKKFVESQERAALFHDRPKNPFGLLTREDERFFGEVYGEFRKNEWPDEDAKEAFVNNVLVEMKGKELRVATSHVGQFLEVLLPLCPREEVKRIMGVFKGHYSELSRHRFGSFALERIAGYCGLWISEEDSNFGTVAQPEGNEDPQSRSLESLLVDMELLYPDMHELFVDPFASHVYKGVLQTLNGHPQVDFDKKRKRKAQPGATTTVPTPDSFAELKSKLLSTVRGWDQTLLQTLVFDKYAVPLIQLIIESDVPKQSKKKSKPSNRTLAEIILFGGGDGDFNDKVQREFVTQMMHDTVASRILETVVRIAPERTAQLFFDTFIKDAVVEVSLDSVANFVVQRSIARVSRPEDIQFLGKEILENASQFIGILFQLISPTDPQDSKVSVITAVLDACSRTNLYEAEAVEEISKALESKSLAGGNPWKTLMTIPDNQKAETSAESKPPYPVSRFGALLANSIIHLTNGQQLIIDPLSENDTPSVLFYMTNPATSHVLESLLSSEHTASISRRKLLNHVLGSVASLAKDPAGSHVIDACWNATRDLRYYREKIARELGDNADDVRADFFGRRVWKNWDMDGFVGGRFDWGRGGTGEEMGFAKKPVVREKPWKRYKAGANKS